MINKVLMSFDDAAREVRDGMTILVGGFGDIGVPFELIDAVVRRGARDLTIVANNCGTGERGLSALFKHHLVRRVYASFPAQPGNHHFRTAVERGEVEVHLVPQGTLAERIRAAGAGIYGFYVRTGAATLLSKGKEAREIGGEQCVLEYPLRGDVALIRAALADRYGNLSYRRASRNFNPVMAMAADFTIAEVDRIVSLGGIDPDQVHTAGVFVDAVVPHGEGIEATGRVG